MDFAVEVDGAPLFVYSAAADAGGVDNTSFVLVPMRAGRPVHISVTLLEGAPHFAPPLTSASLRPLGSPPARLDGPAAVSFVLARPGHHVLELQGEYDWSTLGPGLMIFADPVEPDPPSPSDPSVVYFPAGVHALAEAVPGDRVLELANDTTYYLAPGAVVLGRFRGSGVRNVTVRGRGLLAVAALPGSALPQAALNCSHCGCPGQSAVHIDGGADVAVEGIVIVHATSWNVRLQSLRRVTIRRVKIVGWRCNNDGVDLVSSQGALVERCFIRSDDDAVVLKGIDAAMETRDVVVRDSVLWNQREGNCMEIGGELYNAAVRNVTFERCACLHQQGSVMSIHNVGHAAVHGITYRDIVAEGVTPRPGADPFFHPQWGLKLFDLQISQNARYSGPDMTRRGFIYDIVFSNLTYLPHRIAYLFSRLLGNSSAHAVHDVRFEGVSIAGKVARGLDDLNATANAFVANVTFSP